ncbi:MAG: HD domain-containing protein [Planctomycetota bacterium]
MNRTAVNNLADGQSFDQSFRLADKQVRVNRQGAKYLLLKLADRTGSIVGMMWNVEDSDCERLKRGEYVRGSGRTQIHQGALQVILTKLDPIPDSDVDPSDFDAFDASAADTCLERLRSMLSELRDVHLRALGATFLADDAFVAALRTATAAVNNHHAYPGGLVQHTVDMMELCQLIGPRYERINTELLMFGAFLHDLGKVHEISSCGEMSYTDRGQLVGHIVIGVQMLGEMIERTVESGHDFPDELQTQLEHLIVSHHGQLEFGSPRLPQTLEAVALHHIDNLDAKLVAYTNLIDADLDNGENWTNYHPSIGRKLWKKT